MLETATTKMMTNISIKNILHVQSRLRKTLDHGLLPNHSYVQSLKFLWRLGYLKAVLGAISVQYALNVLTN